MCMVSPISACFTSFTDHNGEKFKLLFTFSLDLFGVASRYMAATL
jgi:hypothetical protein